jgi:UrcA family protein
MAPNGDTEIRTPTEAKVDLVLNTAIKELIMNIKNSAGRNTVRMTWAILAAMSTTMLAGVTQAGGTDDIVPKQVVSYKDLNLNSNEGTRVLYRRIQGAANQVCGKVETRDLQGERVHKACFERAISQAVAAVNSPMLTRVYLAKTVKSGQQLPTIAQVR